MTLLSGPNRLKNTALVSLLAMVIIGPALPVLAQDTLAEARIRKMEAEIRAIQRQVFPGGDGKYFAPDLVQPNGTAGANPALPAAGPVTDLLTRMDALEGQVARLTAQVEENGNRLTKVEEKLGIVPTAAGTATAAPVIQPTATPTPLITATPAPRVVATAAATGPSAQRLAAVRAIVKPQTEDPGDDEYSYGFRLWEARFYPESVQQLKLMVERYPRHSRISFARNLLGRAYLDDGKPRDAASWFLQNYQSDKTGARAPDSLLFLAESMRRQNDTSRACIALAEFGETFAAEAAGRLKAQYDQTRGALKCVK